MLAIQIAHLVHEAVWWSTQAGLAEAVLKVFVFGLHLLQAAVDLRQQTVVELVVSLRVRDEK